MKKRIAGILTISLLLMGMGTACAGESEKKYDYLVTFDYNTENLGVDTNCPDQYLGVKNNSKLVSPGTSGAENLNYFLEQSIYGYYNTGWYLAKLDKDGNPEKDEAGNIVFDRAWDFSSDRVTANITLYADFRPQPTFTVSMPEGGTDIVINTYKPGETINRPTGSRIPKINGYTFFDYYVDEACETVFEWPYTVTSENITIYAKFLKGTWALVHTAQEFNSAVALGKNIYLMDDLDFSETAWTPMVNYNGEINGNGHKLTGISCEVKTNKNTYSNFGLFGVLGESANIHDLTIENALFLLKDEYFQTMNPIKAGLLAYTIDPAARLENVTLSGKLTCTKGNQNILDEELYPICTNQSELNVSAWNGCDFEHITIENN